MVLDPQRAQTGKRADQVINMETLLTLFPTADYLLAMSPDDLVPILLKLASRAGPMFWPHAVAEIKQGTGIATTIEHAYPLPQESQN